MKEEWDWTIEVEHAPVPKGRPRFTAQGHVYTPNKTRMAEENIELLIAQQCPPDVFDGPLAVRIICYMERPKSVKKSKRPLPHVKPDLDNLVKLIKDCCNKLLWKDDAQICEAHCYKLYADDRPPAIIVSVKKMKIEDLTDLS